MDSGLKQRLITGVVLIAAVLLGVLLLPNVAFTVAALVVFVSLAGWEWARLVGLQEFKQGLFVAALLFAGLIVYVWGDIRWAAIVVGVLAWLGALVLLAMYEKGTDLYQQQTWLLRFAAFLILIPAWIAMVTLHHYFPMLVLYLIFLVAIADSGAYFTGKAFGKHKLAPQLSPGKTREGALGGLAGVVLWSVLGALFFGLSAADSFYFILLSLAVGIMSVSGDLFESLIKREAGMKDSGTILPGHGGILDRVDGLLATLPLFTLGVFWSGIFENARVLS
jgi:phosphatidate cytidylyltransferase